VGFEKNSKTLEVEFRNGAIYQFFGVPEDVVAALLGKAGPASSLLQLIKGKYRFSKI
jgi:KTSC domain-containing protein